jgi:hypothetical protein
MHRYERWLDASATRKKGLSGPTLSPRLKCFGENILGVPDVLS